MFTLYLGYLHIIIIHLKPFLQNNCYKMFYLLFRPQNFNMTSRLNML